jgi:hypothetical protein
MMDPKSILAFFAGGESKISNLEIVSGIKQDVLGLEITMYNASLIMQILDGTQQLFEIVTRKLFVEASTGILHFYIRKQITLLDKLQHDEIYLDCLSRIRLDDELTVAVVFNELDDIWMMKFLEKRDFVH